MPSIAIIILNIYNNFSIFLKEYHDQTAYLLNGVNRLKNRYFKLERKSYIYMVTLDNPANDNLMDSGFFIELKDTFERLDEDPEVRAIIINSSGDDFSLGLDLENTFRDIDNEYPGEDGKQAALDKLLSCMRDGLKSVKECSKPVTAAINGICAGAGLSLATACDIRLAEDGAVFRFGELDKGIILDVHIFRKLSPIIGEGFVREFAFTAQQIDSKTAKRTGLLNNVFPDKKSLLDSTVKLSEKIADNIPLCVQSNKKLMGQIYKKNHTPAEETQLNVIKDILGFPCIIEALHERAK